MRRRKLRTLLDRLIGVPARLRIASESAGVVRPEAGSESWTAAGEDARVGGGESDPALALEGESSSSARFLERRVDARLGTGSGLDGDVGADARGGDTRRRIVECAASAAGFV